MQNIVKTSFQMNRRRVISQGIAGALTYSLAQTLWTHDLFASPQDGNFELWLRKLLAVSDRLRTGQISTETWQQNVDALYGSVVLKDLMKHIDFEKLTKNFDFTSAGEKFIDLNPHTGKPFENPPPERNRVITKLAGVRDGLNVPPHGHENTVSAFLVLHGEFHVRQYDKLKTTDKTLVFRKSRDEMQTAGFWSCTSETKRNLHWLTATSGDAFFFSTKINEYLPGRPVKGRVNVDLRSPLHLGSGVLEAQIISDKEAHEIYNHN